MGTPGVGVGVGSQHIGRGKGIMGGETACAEEVRESSVAKWRGGTSYLLGLELRADGEARGWAGQQGPWVSRW